MMKKLFGILAVATFVVGFAATASATTMTWYLNVTLNTGAASGYFTFDTGTTTVTGFDVTVSGTTAADHHYTAPTDSGFYKNIGQYGDPQVDFGTPGFAQFLDLYLASVITSSDTLINLGNASGSAVACPSCTTVSGDIQTTDPNNSIQATVPEPATLSLLGLGLLGLGARFRARRK